MVLYHSRKYLTLPVKSETKPKIIYFCHILAGAAQNTHASLERAQKRVSAIERDELLSPHNPLFTEEMSQASPYSIAISKSSDELHS